MGKGRGKASPRATAWERAVLYNFTALPAQLNKLPSDMRTVHSTGRRGEGSMPFSRDPVQPRSCRFQRLSFTSVSSPSRSLVHVLLLMPLLRTACSARPVHRPQELVPAGYVRAPHYTPSSIAAHSAAAGGAASAQHVQASTPDRSTVMYVPGHGAFVRRCAGPGPRALPPYLSSPTQARAPRCAQASPAAGPELRSCTASGQCLPSGVTLRCQPHWPGRGPVGPA